jgi:hypothetical protein
MTEERPPFVIQRAHGVAPNTDGKKAEENYQMAQPRRQVKPAPAEKVTEVNDSPHFKVLADLITKRNQIDAAIAAIEALYK